MMRWGPSEAASLGTTRSARARGHVAQWRQSLSGHGKAPFALHCDAPILAAVLNTVFNATSSRLGRHGVEPLNQGIVQHTGHNVGVLPHAATEKQYVYMYALLRLHVCLIKSKCMPY